MVGLTYLNLKPLTWRQEVRQHPSIDVEGRYLNVFCRTTADCQLATAEGQLLRDHPIELNVLNGEPSVEAMQKLGLQSGAIGGVWFRYAELEQAAFVESWFCFKTENFGAVWDQVCTGAYTDCWITIGIEPIEDNKWMDEKLSITSAAVRFDRKAPTIQAPVAKMRWFS
jgi:hypothetical protein